MNSPILSPYIKLVLSMIIIGSFIVVNKVLSSTFPLFLASGIRLLIGAIILILLVLIKEKKFPHLSKKDFIVIFTQSFIGVFLFSFFMLYGLKFTSAMESGIITSTTPAIIGLISLIFFKEKLNNNQILGIIFAFIGTLLINVFSSLFHSGWSISLLGNVLIFCAVIGEAVFITFGKLLSKNVSPLASSALTCTFGCALFFPFSLYQAINFDFSGVTFVTWSLIIYTGTFVTVIAVLFLNQAMVRIPTGTSAVFSSLMPVSAVILSFVALNESIHWYHFVGFLFVLAGILSIAKQRKQPAHKELNKHLTL